MSFQARRLQLPDFPWDQLAPYAQKAAAHPHGKIDLSIGTPVDAVPAVIQTALQHSTNAHGYPTTIGTTEVRQAFINWLQRVHGVTCLDLNQVLPTIGSKELIAWLPTLLGLTARDVVAIPKIAYPTYDVGARIAGCGVVAADGLEELERARLQADAAGRTLSFVWLNTPSNPTGAVTPAAELRTLVEWARSHNILLVADECYIDLGWESTPTSLLNPDVCGPSADGLLIVHSLSKRSNLAGYRAAFVAGDAAVIASILEVRKHSGLMQPAPIQAAAVAALDDDAHVAEQRDRYAARRELARAALVDAGFALSHSEAGLYLWATRHESCWQTVDWLASRGVLVAPGSFYGTQSDQHIRVALTASDSDFAQLGERLR